MYTRYEQDLTPFLEHIRSAREESMRQRVKVVREAFDFLRGLCRKT